MLLIDALENSGGHTDLLLRFTVRASGTRERFVHTTSQVFRFLLGRSAFRFQVLIDSWYPSNARSLIIEQCVIEMGSNMRSWCLHCQRPVTTRADLPLTHQRFYS